CTTPAPSSTRRCLVIACRVRLEPPASWEIDCHCPPESLPRSDNRVSSPKAAKTTARPSRPRRLARTADMAFDVLHLLGPAALIHPECLEATPLRNGVEPGFGEE